MTEQQIRQQTTPPANYLVFAILTTIFCCQILGIVSIVYAAQVNSRWASGDFAGAEEASRNAKLWAWISAGIGIAIVGLMMLLATLGVLAGISVGGIDF